MASAEEKVGGPATDDEVLVEGEMVGSEAVDPESSQPDPENTTSKQPKEEGGKSEGAAPAHDLKSALIISGAAMAIIGAIFAIVKKIKGAT